jgi:hypothetical protein
MEKKVVEKNIKIARRMPPGDRWKLEIEEFYTIAATTFTDAQKEKIHSSLTEVLEAYMTLTGFKGEYRLAPLKGELYIIQNEEQEIIPVPEKKYSIYGEY